MVILDSSAVLAALYQEQGTDVVTAHLEDETVITAVNFEETLRILVQRGMTWEAASRTLDELDAEVLDFTAGMAFESAARTAQLPAGLGIADRCCLGAAAKLRASVLTADRAWRDLGPIFGVDVIVIR
ncbi:MAG: PIN domain-containing protein [Candidatus Dormibacteraeota bacterium]|nr:PIN domain-containing protein [Candidatus Dormibacteraeota bacterium]